MANNRELSQFASVVGYNGGNIGIGTDSMTSALQIYAADTGEGTAKGQITLKDTAAYNQTPTGGIVFQGHHTAGAQAIFAGIRGFKANTSDGDYDGCLAFDVRKHGAVAYEAMRINEHGKIGVGVNSPARLLHLHESNSNEALITFTTPTTGATASDGFRVGMNGSEEALVWNSESGIIKFGTANAERLRIDSSGRLLVGTTTEGEVSADNLTIADSGNCGITIRSGTTSAGNIFFSDGTSGNAELRGYIQYKHDSNYLRFATNAAERLRIDSNGYATLKCNSSNIARLSFENVNSTRIEYSNQSGDLSFYTNSAARVKVGYLGGWMPVADNSQKLGTSSNRWTAVYAVNGSIQTSDEREKTGITTSTLGSDFIKQLRPVSYKWTIGENVITKAEDGETDVVTPRPGVRTHWGFIAQEVKQAVDTAGVDFGGWILTDKDDPDSTQGLRYDQFIAPLTKALQEAIAKIETLETQNADLLARVTALEGS